MSKRSAASPAPLSLAKRRRAQQQSTSREHKVSLERVVGLTCITSNGLAVSGSTGCIVYPAGCVAVLYLPKRKRQLHILNSSRKPISSLCLSPDGKYLAIGEYGHQPSVQVWNVAGSPSHVSELKGHNYGIECMAFSPTMKYMASVGYQHDMHINVWNWRAGNTVATNKITSKVYGLDFANDGTYFVTVGNRRVRFWYFNTSDRDGKLNRTAPLKGRSAILGDLQDNCFVAVSCGRGPLAPYTYTLTRSGLLCQFDQSRALDKFVTVQATLCRSLVFSEQYIVCGCGEGVVRLFDPYTLDYLMTMPQPHPLGINVAVTIESSQSELTGEHYPDAIAVALDSTNKRLTVVYSDRSHYVWDVRNLRQIKRFQSFLYHNACIWDLCLYPQLPEHGLLPSSCLVTCSTDNTIRFWTMEVGGASPPSGEGGPSLMMSVYFKDLMRIIYTSSDLSSLNDTSKYPGDASAVADTQRGVRCVKFHPRGHQLAMGDRTGNVRVYDMQFMDTVFEVEAHDAEVLCIEYSPEHEGLQFMASASRDRLIHVFTVGDTYQHVQTMDDHSASITAIRFTVAKKGLQLLSCGADKSIMFRTLEKSPEPQFHRTSHIASKASIYDMDIDAVGKHMATAGQDRVVRVYQLSTGKQKAVIKASTGDEGSLIKVTMDPSGLYIATSSSDKCVSIFDFYSGECLAKLYGHSEVVTQLKFSKDCKYLYSVSADGCIFIWRLSRDITQTMYDRLAEIGTPLPPSTELTPVRSRASSSPVRRDTFSVTKATGNESAPSEQTDSGSEESFRLSVSQLPGWAQRQVQARPSIAKSFSTSDVEGRGRREAGGRGQQVSAVEGRWAQRVSKETIQFASQGAGIVSDEELVDLTDELSGGVAEPDMGVIDLTDSPPEHVTVRGDTGEQEEVAYPLGASADVDPSTFKVVTPEKPRAKRRVVEGSQEEEEEEEEEEEGMETPDDSPQESVEADFLKTNFESLSMEQADLFFTRPPDQSDPRLSISARFFSQSSKRGPPWSQHHVTDGMDVGASPNLPISSGGGEGGREEKRQGDRGKGGGRGGGEGGDDGEEEDGGVDRRSGGEGGGGGGGREGDGEQGGREGGGGQEKMEASGSDGASTVESEESSKVAESSGRESRPASERESGSVGKFPTGEPTDGLTKRSPAIQEEINRTKKRLEELGYAVPAKTPTQPESEPHPPPPSSQPHPPPPHSHPHPSPPSSQPHGTHKTIKVKSKQRSTSDPCQPHPLRAATPPMSEEEPLKTTTPVASHSPPSVSLLSRATECIEGLNAQFRNLVALHEQAVEGLSLSPGESLDDCKQSVCAIATAISSLKSQTICLANSHRKKWREVAQRRQGSATGGEVDSETTGQLEEGTATAKGTVEEGRNQERTEEGGERTEKEGGRGEEEGGGRKSEGTVEGGQQSREPEVMELLGRYSEQLLERYSEQLVELVKEKTLRLSD